MNSILLVGAGKMGAALLRGWSQLSDFQTMVIDPTAHQSDDDDPERVTRHQNLSEIPPAQLQPDAIVFAVKPQSFAEVLPDYQPLIARTQPLVISIAAGVPIARIRSLSKARAILRTMPNLPATVGRGVTALLAEGCTRPQLHLAETLMKAVGTIEWLKSESQFDAVTALSGSGPAYVFLLAEAMASAGATLGLEPELAARLAQATVVGASELLARSDYDPETLRHQVTSKGGTTAAALEILMQPNGVPQLLTKAMTAARDRSVELGK
ncbi:MAG: pyrroline-5-carboxylate reductase [Alphaproteobacteria bacterium]|nr:pyrroline-5-carboxylate reductase [Alphaproteobacteria bacterium]